MGLPKGTTNNRAGRPKGKPNQITAELRTRIGNFLGKNWKQVEKDFEKLSTEKKILFFEKLLKYVLPQMRENNSLDIESLTEQQLDQVIKRMINNEDTQTPQ